MSTVVRISVPLVLTDQLGGPLPPETRVAIYPVTSPPTPDAIVASGYVGMASQLVVPLEPSKTYRIRFIGNRMGPYVQVQTFTVFDPNLVEIAVDGYVSPVLSLDGFVQEQYDNWTRGLLGVDAPPVLAAIVAEVIADMFVTVQTGVESVIADANLFSSVDAAVATWARDFFGDTLPWFPNEPREAYIGRIVDALSPDNMTLRAIATKVRAFLVLQLQYGAQQVMALDTAGSVDQFGGLDTAGDVLTVPTVTAFDRQSDPGRSAMVGLLPGDVCVLFSYPGLLQQGLFLDGSHFLDGNTFLNSGLLNVLPNAPNPALADYVNHFVKAVGVRIVYADNRTA